MRPRPQNERGKTFRRVPTWLFLDQVEARHARREPFEVLEAWCSMDYDLYRHGDLASERAYVALWNRPRGWVRHAMQLFREDRALPQPLRGRRPKTNGAHPASAGEPTISQTIS